MSIVTPSIQSMPQGLDSKQIERLIQNLREDVKQLAQGEKGTIKNVRDITSAYTPVSDDDVLMCWGDTTVTLPVAGDISGKMYWIKDISTNQITVDSSSTLDDVTRHNLDASKAICIVDDGSEWRIVSGYQI